MLAGVSPARLIDTIFESAFSSTNQLHASIHSRDLSRRRLASTGSYINLLQLVVTLQYYAQWCLRLQCYQLRHHFKRLYEFDDGPSWCVPDVQGRRPLHV